MPTKVKNVTITPEIRKRIEGLRIIDDIFMNLLFQDDTKVAELVIRTIIGKDDLEVKRVRVQHKIENIGRSIQTDIFATDSKGTLYDIEIQRSAAGASPKRLRFHSAMLDVDYLKRSTDFDKLPEKYIIFITENDYFKKGKPIYSFANTLLDDDLKLQLDDGQHYIYVNATNNDDTPLGRLMQDFMATDPNKMHYEILRERSNYFKTTKKGVQTMGNVSEELRAEGKTSSIKTLAKYLKKTATKAEAIKMLMGAYGLSESDANKIYTSA